ncbi:MAG TPA: hypothetical protein VF900_08025, partial [Candidatus Acidoferrum sp.]
MEALSLTFGQFYQILDCCKSQFVSANLARPPRADFLRKAAKNELRATGHGKANRTWAAELKWHEHVLTS